MDHLDRGVMDGRPILRARLAAADGQAAPAMNGQTFSVDGICVMLGALLLSAVCALVLLAVKVKDAEAQRQDLEYAVIRAHDQRDACTLTLKRALSAQVMP